METTPRRVIGSVVRSVCGQKIEQLIPLTGGGLNEAYRVEVDDGPSLVVRIARRPEPWFTSEESLMARARTVDVPTPEVLGVEHVEQGGELLSFSVLRFVPGRPLDELVGVLSPTDLDRLLMDGGELLARLHSVEMEAGNGVGTGAAVGAGEAAVERGMRHTLSPPEDPVVTRAAGAAEQTLGPAAAAIVADGIEFLHRELSSRPRPKLALAHGDFLPKHLLIGRSGTISAVIDWEFAGSAPPAFDLAHWEVAARSGLHVNTDLVRRGYRRVADPDLSDGGWVPAFAVRFALDVLGWEKPAPPERLRRCVEVIAHHARG